MPVTHPCATINGLGAGANQAATGNHAHAHAALTGLDTDASATAIHHTLGAGANQAAAGNHAHSHAALTGLDTDASAAAIHHTLGAGANQAAAGNHGHSYLPLAGGVVTGNLHMSAGNASLSMDDAGLSGQGFKKITCNDGGGNWNFRASHYFSGSYRYERADDGAAAITINTESADGTIDLSVAAKGVNAGDVITWPTTLQISSAGVKVNGNVVWHAGNDGHGSSLDADTVDGRHGDELGPAALRMLLADRFNAF